MYFSYNFYYLEEFCMRIVNRYCKPLLFTAALVGTTAALSAQSATSAATGGIFTSDTDKIQSVTEFSGVDFEQWLAGSNFHANTLDLGGALKFGSIVVSPWYKGWVVDASSTKTETAKVTDLLDSTNSYSAGTSVTTRDTTTGWEKLNSNVAVLVGINDFIGIKLGYTNADTAVYRGTYYAPADTSYPTEETSTATTVNSADGTTVYKSVTLYDDEGELGKTVHTPSLEVGAKLSVGDITIKPRIGFAVGFNNSFSHSSYKQTTYPEGTSQQSYYEYDYDNTSTDIMPSVGVKLQLAETARGFRHSFDLGWSGTFIAYDDWEAQQSTKTVTTTTSDTTTETKLSGNVYDDNSYSKNIFTLGYKVEKDIAEGLTLAGKVGLGYSLENRAYSYQNKTTSTRVEDYGTYKNYTYTTTVGGDSQDYEKSENVFTPTLAGAVRYNISEKVRFNAGAVLTLPVLTVSKETTEYPEVVTTTTRTKNGDGTITEEKTVIARTGTYTNEDVATAAWSSASASASVGFTWFLSENFSIDSALQLGIDGGSSIFSNSVNIGALIKY